MSSVGMIRGARIISQRRVGTPPQKSGQADQVAQALQRHLVEIKQKTLANWWPEVPRWVFSTEESPPTTEDRFDPVSSKRVAAGAFDA